MLTIDARGGKGKRVEAISRQGWKRVGPSLRLRSVGPVVALSSPPGLASMIRSRLALSCFGECGDGWVEGWLERWNEGSGLESRHCVPWRVQFYSDGEWMDGVSSPRGIDGRLEDGLGAEGLG